MNIKKLKIIAFGKLKNKEIEFKPGLNLVYGENESGKSTVQNFIKAMFYGLNSQKQSIKDNYRKKYMPWSNEPIRGELYFEDDNAKEYVIYRSFHDVKRRDEYLTYDKITGEPVSKYDSESPGEDIFGISEEAFEKTLFIKQLSSQISRDKNDEIMKKLMNLGQTGEEDISYYYSIKTLEGFEKGFENTRKTGLKDLLKTRLSNLKLEEEELYKIHEDNINDLMEFKEIEEQIINLSDEIRSIDYSKKLTKDVSIYNEYNELRTYNAEKNELLTKLDKINDKLVGIDESKYNNILLDYEGIIEKESEVLKLKSNIEMYENNMDLERQSLGKLIDYENVTPEIEEEISNLEEEKNSYQEKAESKTRVENLKLRQDILKGKSKLYIILSIISAMLIGLGLYIGYTKNYMYYILTICSCIVFIYFINEFFKIKKALTNLKVRMNKESGWDYAANDNDIIKLEEINNKLKSYYNEYNVYNYSEFKRDLRQFNVFRNQWESIKGTYKAEKNRVADIEVDINEKKLKLFEYLGFQSDDTQDVKNTIENIGELLSERKELLEEINLLKVKIEMLSKGKEINDYENFIENFDLDEAEINFYDEDEDVDSLDLKYREKNEELLRLEKMLGDKQTQIVVRFNGKRDLDTVQEEIDECQEEIEKINKKLKAAKIAREEIKNAFDELQKDFGPRLNKKTAEIFSGITNGKYKSVKVSEEYNINVVDTVDDMVRSSEYLSNGTLDQVYFSTRIAITLLIFKDRTNIPLLFDESFIQYDDNRLKNSLDYLYELSKEHQVILFTCQKREEKFLSGKTYNKIVI